MAVGRSLQNKFRLSREEGRMDRTRPATEGEE